MVRETITREIAIGSTVKIEYATGNVIDCRFEGEDEHGLIFRSSNGERIPNPLEAGPYTRLIVESP